MTQLPDETDIEPADAQPRRRRHWIFEHFQRRKVTRLEATSLTEMLDRLEFVERENDKVRLGAMLEIAGRRSFGPMLLVPGLLVLSPVSGVPGVPTFSGMIVLLLSVQLLIGRSHFWLPGWLLDRCLPHRHLLRAVRLMRPLARGIDRLLKPRLSWLVESHAVYAVAATCALVALTMPPLELVPFAATAAGVAITAFGLALVGRDGLLALLAFGFCGATAWLLGQALL